MFPDGPHSLFCVDVAPQTVISHRPESFKCAWPSAPLSAYIVAAKGGKVQFEQE